MSEDELLGTQTPDLFTPQQFARMKPDRMYKFVLVNQHDKPTLLVSLKPLEHVRHPEIVESNGIEGKTLDAGFLMKNVHGTERDIGGFRFIWRISH